MPRGWAPRIAAGFLLLLSIAALAAPWLPIADPAAMDADARLQAPRWIAAPMFGTDAQGRDLFARALFGARVSLTVGLFGTLIALLVGVPYGAAAGLIGGRTAGLGRRQLLRRHLLPNMAPALWAMISLTVPRVILMEAFLSFLGLGVEAPSVSWGSLAADGMAALNPLVGSWWLLAVPATGLAATLLSLNLLGDSLRRKS